MSIENFTGKAESYAKGRPGYPKEAIKKIFQLVSSEAIFADIGAGTGKFTIKIAERGYSVFAVEPNADMRNQLAITLEPFEKSHIIDGTAETTTLPDNSVDIITIAHALHWFNIDEFKIECTRILKPNGFIIVIYNHLSDKNTNDVYKQTVDKFLTNYTMLEFANPITYTLENWINYIASQDNNPSHGEPEFDEHIAAIISDFESNSSDGLLQCDRVTRMYIKSDFNN
ncbi:class I SAM-dependent methyltransferase [Clostridium sp. B9]|uniref:class I SAM-dependent methyltransferase n=1 Tax=Clostridium sp. B9 TaxID=3423224 RepID=UPI003D2EAF17